MSVLVEYASYGISVSDFEFDEYIDKIINEEIPYLAVSSKMFIVKLLTEMFQGNVKNVVVSILGKRVDMHDCENILFLTNEILDDVDMLLISMNASI